MELQDVLRWSVKDGDVLFVNADAVDIDAFRRLNLGVRVIIIPVQCQPGTSISDSVAVLQTKEVV